MKHAISILGCFEYFCQISSKSVLKISSYTVSKLDRFWDTVYNVVDTSVHASIVNHKSLYTGLSSCANWRQISTATRVN